MGRVYGGLGSMSFIDKVCGLAHESVLVAEYLDDLRPFVGATADCPSFWNHRLNVLAAIRWSLLLTAALEPIRKASICSLGFCTDITQDRKRGNT